MGGFFFICAMVGAAIYTICTSSENATSSANTKKFKTEYELDEERRKQWMEKAVDHELEVQLEDGLCHCDEALLKEVRDSWPDYFDEEAPGRFINIARDMDFEEASSAAIFFSTALRILLANRGKIMYSDAVYGIKFACGGTGSSRLDEEKRMRRYTKFFYKIRQNLSMSDAQASFYSIPYVYGINKWSYWGKYYSGTLKFVPSIPKRELFGSNIYSLE